MQADKDTLDRTSAQLVWFLYNSRDDLTIEDSDFDRYEYELKSRLKLLLENDVLGDYKPLGLSQYGTVHSRLTPS